MIVKCIRCNTEFSSSHNRSHVCPRCHFVFSEDDSGKAELEIVRSCDLVHQSTGHHLLEEAEEKCSFHPDADAVGNCIRCGRAVCYACAIETGGGYFCEACDTGPVAGEAVEKKRAPEPPPATVEQPRVEAFPQAMAKSSYVAWEYRHHFGRLNALSGTWQQTLFNPLRFFRGIPIGGDMRSPLLYGLVWALVALAGGIAWKLLVHAYPIMVLFVEGKPLQFSLQLSDAYIYLAGLILLSPLFALISILVACLMYHLFVVLFAPQHAGFEATVRVICYSMGTNMFYFIPLAGGLIGETWQFILVTLGLREVYRISLPAAVGIAVLPYTLLLIPKIAFMLWAVSGSALGAEDLLGGIILSLLA